MVAYDYARRGDTVTGVYTNQVSGEFLPTVGRNPAWAAWGPTDSIFGMRLMQYTEFRSLIYEPSHLGWRKRL
jgi:hypothetical protein